MYLSSWASVLEAIESRLIELTDCHEKWIAYERHRVEVMERVADVEKLVHTSPAAVVGGETEHRLDVDRIRVCVIIH